MEMSAVVYVFIPSHDCFVFLHVTVVVCSLCATPVFFTDWSAVPSSLQDDGDVEDDMTIREVRRSRDRHTHTRNYITARQRSLLTSKQLVQPL